MGKSAPVGGLCVYFNHSISRKQGRRLLDLPRQRGPDAVDVQANSLLMEWCLNCHRNSEMALRPLDKVYDMTWQPAAEPVRNWQNNCKKNAIFGARSS